MDRICPHWKKGEERLIHFDLLTLFMQFSDGMFDCLVNCVLDVLCLIYMYMFTMVPARCNLDHVWILSLDLAGLSLLRSCCDPVTFMYVFCCVFV